MTPPSSPNLLLCEGPEDKAFFRQLRRARDIRDFRVEDTSDENSRAGGNTKFKSRLIALRYRKHIRKILIVADNDDDPAESFANVRSQIEEVFNPGSAPNQPLVSNRGTPEVTILMVPWENQHGCLETICKEAARNYDANITSHVNTFSALLTFETRPSENRKSKMWLRSMLAASCERDPFIPLGSVFTENRYQQLIPLTDRAFDRIANAINDWMN